MDPQAPDVVATALADVRRRAREAWAALLPGVLPGVLPGGRPTAWLAPGPVPGTVVARSRHGVRGEPAGAAARRLLPHLERGGWSVRPGVPVPGVLLAVVPGPAGRVRLVATRTRTGAGGGALLVTVEADPLPVGGARALDLVGP